MLRCMGIGNLNGQVRLTATCALADGFLVDRLGGFNDRYPDIELELIGDPRIVSLVNGEADIALRQGSAKERNLIARRVASIAFGYYASAAYCDKLRAGQTAAFIGFDQGSDFIFEASWLTRQFPARRFVFRTNSQMSQAAAARAGYGLALLPRYMAAKHPGLVPVPFGQPMPDRDVWLLVRPDVAERPPIKAVAESLVELFRREQHVLANG